MASLAAKLGSGAMTNSVRGIEDMEVIFIIGSNTKETHPVIANRMLKARRKGAKIIVADPRRVPMVKHSDVFLRLRPGTDIALLNALCHVIIKEGLADKEFIEAKTEGYDELARNVEKYTPEYASSITGIKAEEIIKAARMYANSDKGGIFYTMGVTQHSKGTDNVSAVANLALLTGNIGKPHTGVNPLRGQNNVQGACDAGALPDVYPGYQKVHLPENHTKYEKLWGRKLSNLTGLKSTEMLEEINNGKIKALYIMGENPVISDANMDHTVHSLKKLDFIVVQDIFLTETAELADVVLPASCFAEKDGTFTNTDRTVQRVRKAVTAPGSARNDTDIIREVSLRMGYDMGLNTPEQIFNELCSTWTNMSGMSYARIDNRGLQWPCPTPEHPGTEYLYKDGFPLGRAKFTAVGYTPAAEPVDDAYPMILTTGRNLFQYHTGSMTRRSAPIEAHAGEPYVEMSYDDAARMGINDRDVIKVTSRRGAISIKARLTLTVAEGTVFVPMHYKEAAANVLTNDALDPVSKIPELKVCAVKIEK